MTRFLGTPLKGEDFSSASSEAFSAKVASDTQARIRIDAGGRITWGDGASAGDVYVYRYDDDILKFVGNVVVDALFIGSTQISTTGASLDQVLKYDGTKFAPGTNVATVENIEDIGDVVLTTPQLGDVLRYSGGNWVNDVIPEINSLDDIAGVNIIDPLNYQTLTFDGTNWVNKDAASVTLVTNAETTSLAAGEVVYLFGAQGNRATVKRASNTSDATSSKTVGIVAQTILPNGTGAVVTQGYVSGLNTSAYTPGDVLWLSSTAGQFTTTKAVAPNHLVFIGVVARANAGNGIVYVKTQNGYEVNELHDVKTNGKAVGDVLMWDGSLWVNSQIDLATDTVGSYVASLVAGTGVTLENNSGEGATPTIAIGQAVGSTDSPTFAGATLDAIQIGITASNEIDTTSGNLTIDSAGGTVTIDDNLTVSGNLTVNGTTTTVNSTTITVDDPIITLGGDTAPSSDDNKDRGVEFRYHNGAAPKVGFFGYDDSTGRFVMIPDATNSNEVFSGSVGDIQAGTFYGNLSGNATNITASSNTSLTSLANLTTVGTLSSLLVSGSTSTDLVKITQAGTGNAFVVEDITSDTTPFVIDASGSVGIGISAPTVTLDVLGSTTIGTQTGVTAAFGSLSTGRLLVGSVSGTTPFVGSQGATNLNLTTNGVARVVIDSTGQVGFGVTPSAGRALTISNTITGSTSSFGIVVNSAVYSDVTSSMQVFRSAVNTSALSFTLGNLYHFYTGGVSTPGSGSAITNQYGFVADVNHTGATYNYGFFGNIPSGTNRWNLYMGGTANNYLAGRLGIGTNAPDELLDVRGNIALTGSVIFEGATANAFETTISVTDPTADRTITFPDASGTVAVSGQNVSFNDVTVAGNLNVTGSTFGSATLDVDNYKITLNASVTGAPTLNGEIEVNRGTSADVRIRWNESLDLWEYTNDGSTYSRIGSALMTVSDTPPSSPYTGDLWFESDSGITFVRYDSHWIEIGASGIGAVTSDTAPSNPANGQVWFESDTNQLKIYYSGSWIQVGGADAVNVINAINAKGDLIVGTANDTVTRLAAGANDYVLTANSSTTSGLEWVSRAAIVDDFAVASIMGAY